MSKFLKRKKFSIQRHKEIIEYIKPKEFVSWGELETNLGMKIKKLREILKHTELCVCLNSKRQFFTLRDLVLKQKKTDSPIWITKGKAFSCVGNLKQTVLHLIEMSPDGTDEKTLTKMLLTPTKNVLKELKDEKKVKVVSFEGRTVYFSLKQKRFSKQFQRRLGEENCNEIQITYEEFFKTLNLEIRHIAKELVPPELKEAEQINYKEFVKLLLVEPKLAYTSDRQISRLLKSNNRVRKMLKPKIFGHSAISKYKEFLRVEFYVRMFEFLVEKVIKFAKLKEVTIITDCTENKRYKRDVTHFRCHTGILAELKCPIALIVTKGKVHESPVFERILSKIEELKIKIKYVICDAGYDAARIFVRVAKRLKALAVIPTRDMKKSPLDIETFQLSLDYYFESVYAKEIQELVSTLPEEKAGERIRELVDYIKNIDWWKEIYKMRTGVERLFSWMKSFLGLSKPNAYSMKQAARHAYQVFSFAVAQALCALKLGIENKTASFRSFIV